MEVALRTIELRALYWAGWKIEYRVSGNSVSGNSVSGNDNNDCDDYAVLFYTGDLEFSDHFGAMKYIASVTDSYNTFLKNKGLMYKCINAFEDTCIDKKDASTESELTDDGINTYEFIVRLIE